MRCEWNPKVNSNIAFLFNMHLTLFALQNCINISLPVCVWLLLLQNSICAIYQHFDICQKKEVSSYENSIESISDFCVQHAKILLLDLCELLESEWEEGKMNLKYRAVAIQLVSIPIALVHASRVCVYRNIEINIFLC